MKKINLSSLAITIFLLLSLLLSGCSSVSALFASPTPTPSSTPLPTNTPTPTATPTNTPTPSRTPTPTITPNTTATQMRADMAARVQDFYDASYIPSTKGKYVILEDYTNSWAQLNWYQWHNAGYKVKDFIVRANIKWDTAAISSSYYGCGFVFHADPETKEHYLVYLSGYDVGFLANIGGTTRELGSRNYGPVWPGEPQGEATLTIAMNGDKVTVLVNDEFVGTFNGRVGKLPSGSLAYTVLSGTNKDYGTRCTFTNIELWIVTP